MTTSTNTTDLYLLTDLVAPLPATTSTNATDLRHLIDLIAALPAATSPADAGLIPVTATAVGEVVWVYARGQYRRGVVTKVTPTRADVTYTTQGALDESARIYATWEAASEDEEIAYATRRARGNWRFKTAMADGTADFYKRFTFTPEEKRKEMATYADQVAAAGSEEAYVQAEVDRARTSFRAKKAENTSPLAHVKITCKTSKIADLFRDPTT
ncbi:hypothetical protein ACGFJC_47725 [Nonomuraea fuscirosea]|uniref:hypothetical protein n=1 Tax=Nonomuraea fuscirosea TaxID=1291556 RepID=UPI00371AB3F4